MTSIADDDLPWAATVLLLRSVADGGVEVLMMQRPDRGSFASAWVFPGGRVEAADVSSDAGMTLRRAAVREVAEETGLHVEVDALVPVSEWIPPVTEPKRIRTWFFAASDPGGRIRVQASEVVRAEWFRPADMLALHAAGDARLYPPTFVTLLNLRDAVDAESALARLDGASVRTYATLARVIDGARMFSWDGDDGTAATPEDQRHRLDASTLPWRYVPPRPAAGS
ncbi:NUDIX hydrolase [Microbacterium nymphoidis]|uniref:NUDIX hydrolase n=1 Tax=Microbacterium nymphoidis TaxID=2898586 RepID=UPI001E44CC82|nr:NUDIX hydrolase [Microbacterium nymphoidis]MCD2499800.1 NUDIX hydrolase [Microbacterium nymphoidis]